MGFAAVSVCARAGAVVCLCVAFSAAPAAGRARHPPRRGTARARARVSVGRRSGLLPTRYIAGMAHDEPPRDASVRRLWAYMLALTLDPQEAETLVRAACRRMRPDAALTSAECRTLAHAVADDHRVGARTRPSDVTAHRAHDALEQRMCADLEREARAAGIAHSDGVRRELRTLADGSACAPMPALIRRERRAALARELGARGVQVGRPDVWSALATLPGAERGLLADLVCFSALWVRSDNPTTERLRERAIAAWFIAGDHDSWDPARLETPVCATILTGRFWEDLPALPASLASLPDAAFGPRTRLRGRQTWRRRAIRAGIGAAVITAGVALAPVAVAANNVLHALSLTHSIGPIRGALIAVLLLLGVWAAGSAWGRTCHLAGFPRHRTPHAAGPRAHVPWPALVGGRAPRVADAHEESEHTPDARSPETLLLARRPRGTRPVTPAGA